MVKFEIVKAKGNGFRWAQKATIGTMSRYRGFRYKKEAIENLDEWEYIDNSGSFQRDFYHNFHTKEDLGIEEV